MAEISIAPAPEKTAPTPATTPVAKPAAPTTPVVPEKVSSKSKSIEEDLAEIDTFGKKETKHALEKSTESKPGEAGKTSEGASKPGPVKGSMAEFRLAHDKLKADHATLQAEHARLKSAKPPEDADKPKLLGAVESMKKENERLQETIRLTNFESSDDFKSKKEKYQKEYETDSGRSAMSALQLKVPTAEGSRKLTEGEFWDIVRIEDTDAALAAAEQIFGEGSTRANAVIERRNEIRRAFEREQSLLAEAREVGNKTSKEHQEKEAQRLAIERGNSDLHQRKTSEEFIRLKDERIASAPDYNVAAEDDETGASLLKAGDAQAWLLFGDPTPEQIESLNAGIKENIVDGKLTPEGRVKLHASAFSALRENPFIRHKLGLAKIKIAELEETVKAYESGAPENAGGQGRERAAGEKSAEQEFREAAAAGR